MAQAGADRDRARKKAIDVSKTALDGLVGLAIPESHRDAVKKMIDLTFETVKAGRHRPGGPPMRRCANGC